LHAIITGDHVDTDFGDMIPSVRHQELSTAVVVVRHAKRRSGMYTLALV
jgi:hypothetical protein